MTVAGRLLSSSIRFAAWGTASNGRCLTARILAPPNQDAGGTLSDIEFPCDPVPAVEADGVQPGLAAHAASFGQQRFGNASRVIDPRVLPPDPGAMPDFDLLCGGFPCQAFSIAGKRKGFEDARGTLFFEIARVARAKRPAYLLLENVPGLLSHDGRFLL